MLVYLNLCTIKLRSNNFIMYNSVKEQYYFIVLQKIFSLHIAIFIRTLESECIYAQHICHLLVVSNIFQIIYNIYNIKLGSSIFKIYIYKIP